ncbi:MAG: transcription elongation factor GreA [Chloroflexota bacterium]
MIQNNQSFKLSEAVSRFLASLTPAEREANQPELLRFVRWYGWDKTLDNLTAPDMDTYAEHLAQTSADHAQKLELVRGFLNYAKKEKWLKTNLAVHLKAKKGKSRTAVASKRVSGEKILLTEEGQAKLKAELAVLESKRPEIIEQMRLAAADKDFKENAPLAAVREEKGHLEGKIIEIKGILKSAVVTENKQRASSGANIGNSVILQDSSSGEERRYTLVGPREVDPLKGKISVASPIGKAVVGRGEGEVLEVQTPAGRWSCLIKSIER